MTDKTPIGFSRGGSFAVTWPPGAPDRIPIGDFKRGEPVVVPLRPRQR